jgi:hypothetical protein
VTRAPARKTLIWAGAHASAILRDILRRLRIGPAAAVLLLVPLLGGCVAPEPMSGWRDRLEPYCGRAWVGWFQPEAAVWARSSTPEGWRVAMEPQEDGLAATIRGLPLQFGTAKVQSVEWMDAAQAHRWNPEVRSLGGPRLWFEDAGVRLQGTFREPEAPRLAREDFAAMLRTAAGLQAADADRAVEAILLGDPYTINGVLVRDAFLEVRTQASAEAFLSSLAISPFQAGGFDGFGDRSNDWRGEASWRVDYSVPVRQFTQDDGSSLRMLRVAADGRVEYVEADHHKASGAPDERARETAAALGAPAPTWQKQGHARSWRIPCPDAPA